MAAPALTPADWRAARARLGAPYEPGPAPGGPARSIPAVLDRIAFRLGGA